MTMRSTSAPHPHEHPKISFVFPVHDPEYGGGLLARTQRHLVALIAFANRYHLVSEIIIVEWNPRPDRATFRESLRWPDDLGTVSLRFIEVPVDIHRRFPNAERLPIFEYIAKNAGIRRARGQFVLATNPDLFYSPALIRWLARASFSPGKFYRIDRRDLSEDIPAGLSLSRQLRFCSQHVAHVHALFGSYRAGESDGPRRLEAEYHRRLREPAGPKRWTNTQDAQLMFPSDGLHRNAAGDFFLMEREWWQRLRGYPELYTHAHIDAILCWVASSAGCVQEVIPSRCHLYHQAHDRASRGGFPQTDWRPWYQRYQEAMRQGPSGEDPPMVVNPPDWGLANDVLPEWQARPQLVQVRNELESSMASRITRPIRHALTSFARLRGHRRRDVPEAAVEASVSAGGEHSLAVRSKKDATHDTSDSPAPAKAVDRVAPVDASTPTTTKDAPRTLAQLLSKRFRELEPLRVFKVPGDAPRVSLVVDSISASSLFNGVGTAVVVAALLARHLGARLRVVTLTEPPEPGNVGGVLTTHRIPWSGDIEFVHIGPGRKEEVPVGDHELFVTASWWSTRRVLPLVRPGRLVCLLQEDERMFHAWGDDRLRCVETLSDPGIRFVINRRLLFDHLTQGPDALPNILANGVWFEPVFPVLDRERAEVDPVGGQRQFFCHLRPNNHPGLYWRALEAIGGALEENVLDPSAWTLHLAGDDAARLELPRGVRPHVVQNLPWADYVKLVRRMDVVLCLMDAPYASYPPLDLAASRAVMVTNQHASSTMFASDSDLVICSDSSIEGLKRGIAEAAARTADRGRPPSYPARDQIGQDWEAALAPVLARLYPDRTLG